MGNLYRRMRDNLMFCGETKNLFCQVRIHRCGMETCLQRAVPLAIFIAIYIIHIYFTTRMNISQSL